MGASFLGSGSRHPLAAILLVNFLASVSQRASRIRLFCKPRPVGKLASTFPAGIASVFIDVQGAEKSSAIDDRLTENPLLAQLCVFGVPCTPDR